MIRKPLIALLAWLGAVAAAQAATEHYVIDTEGMHAFVVFRVQHLGFSWMEGRFNRFKGRFDYDEADPSKNRVEVEIDVASIDTNHAERDKHLRSEDFFDVEKFPKATFVSTKWTDLGDGKARLEGKLTLRGITRDVAIDVEQVGAGKDPWGGFRRGFLGTTTLKLSDYKMKKGAQLGPWSENIELWLSVEGIRQ